MTFEEFDKYQEELLKEVVGMKDTKGKEYAHSKDRFANFNRLSSELEITNYKIGYVYLKKHLDSIASFMKEGKTFSDEGIRGRFVDAITYLTLISGMISETKVYKIEVCKEENTLKVGSRVRYRHDGSLTTIVSGPHEYGNYVLEYTHAYGTHTVTGPNNIELLC